MTITERRKEFLQKIVNLFQHTGLPVHYAAVARALGVSKWTAYDMLKELEKEKYLRSEYIIGRGEKAPGRSMVVFRPTEKALQFLPEQMVSFEEWSTVRERLLSLFDNMKNINPQKLKEELLEEMSRIELPVVFSAYTITLLIAQIREINTRGVASLQQLLQTLHGPELVLSFFAGSAIGTMLKNMKDTVNSKIISCIHRFEKHISECDVSERKLLAGFLNEALQRVQ